MINIKLKYTEQVLNDPEFTDNLPVPETKTEFSSAYDIIAVSDPEFVGEMLDGTGGWSRIDYIQYRTGIQLAPPIDVAAYHTLIHPRSSISKYNLLLANSIGLCDADYTGEFLVRFKYMIQPQDWEFREGDQRLYAHIDLNRIYKKGDTIAQLLFEKSQRAAFTVVDQLPLTDRGSGGFGSTGK